MTAAPLTAPGPAPTTALAAAMARMRRRAARTTVFMVALCLSIALLLTAFDHRHFERHLLYSFAIGMCCYTSMEATRLLLAWTNDRLRQARGLAPHESGFGSGWRGIGPALLVCMLVGPVAGTALGDLLTGAQSPSLLRLESVSTRITVAMTIVASVASVFVLSMMERLSGARAQAEAAQRQAAENQLKLLESQLEPHMLFNTLANLRVLIALDPARAQDMLDRLIAFLRATLSASRTGSHPLSAEFDRIGDYLALMGVRMGPRLQVRLDLPAPLRDLPVPPLLLQPLVENAIKHGLEPALAGGVIEVAARREGDELVLQVSDTGVGLAAGEPPRESGFGLTQVRERLATLHGGRASLVLERTTAPSGGTRATLRLPIGAP